MLPATRTSLCLWCVMFVGAPVAAESATRPTSRAGAPATQRLVITWTNYDGVEEPDRAIVHVDGTPVGRGREGMAEALARTKALPPGSVVDISWTNDHDPISGPRYVPLDEAFGMTEQFDAVAGERKLVQTFCGERGWDTKPQPPSRPATAPPATTQPVSLAEVRLRRNRFYQFVYDVRCELTNTRDKPAWFVLPYAGAGFKGVKDARFVTDGAGLSGEVFDGQEQGGRGQAVVITGLGFRAVKLPVRGHVRFDGFVLQSDQPLTKIEVWEAASLVVNDTIPIEDWLRCPLGSDVGAWIPQGLNSRHKRSIEFSATQSARPPQNMDGPLRSVKAEVIRSLTVPIDASTRPEAR